MSEPYVIPSHHLISILLSSLLSPCLALPHMWNPDFFFFFLNLASCFSIIFSHSYHFFSLFIHLFPFLFPNLSQFYNWSSYLPLSPNTFFSLGFPAASRQLMLPPAWHLLFVVLVPSWGCPPTPILYGLSINQEPSFTPQSKIGHVIRKNRPESSPGNLSFRGVSLKNDEY